MAGLATKETNHDVAAYLDTIEPSAKQEDAHTLVAMMKEVSGEEPKLWGEHGMIGFGKYTYTRKGSKEELEWFQMGFAARKTKVTVYLTSDINQYEEQLSRLGKYKTGKGCLYINKLADVDLAVLKELIQITKDVKWI